jgi:hypothetical protein
MVDVAIRAALLSGVAVRILEPSNAAAIDDGIAALPTVAIRDLA